MNFFTSFLSDYGPTILYTVLTAVFAWLGVKVKMLADKYLNDHTKREVARTVVQAIEQLYKNLHSRPHLRCSMKKALPLLTWNFECLSKPRLLNSMKRSNRRKYLSTISTKTSSK